MFISPSIHSAIMSAPHDRYRHVAHRTTPYTPETTLLHLGKTELADLVYDSTSTAFNAWEWTALFVALQALSWRVPCWWHWVKRANVLPPKWIRTTKQVTRFLVMSSFALEVVSIFVSSVTGTVLLSHGEGSRQQNWIHITVGVATPSWIWILHNRTISLVGCCGTGNYHSTFRAQFQTNECVFGKLPHDAQFLDTGLLQQPLDVLRRLLWNDKTTYYVYLPSGFYGTARDD